ncbi:MAG TPA: hypothetical protein VFQ53_17445 [Kofleriaceae bacterium]|nr:hypothetical protein [Kofleriaceae bacterium]
MATSVPSETDPGSGSTLRAISDFLAGVRARLYRHESRRAWLYLLAALAALALVLPALGKLAAGSRTTAFALLGIAGLVAMGVIGGAIVLGVVVPRRKYGSDPALARWVGAKRRELASDLLSSVELAHAPTRPGAPSAVLVDALIDATADRVRKVDPVQLFDREELHQPARWAIALVAVNLLVLVIAPSFVGGGWKALLASPQSPFDGAQVSNVPLVGDLEARLEFPPYARRAPLKLPSASGDVRGLPGTQVTLSARVLVPARAGELVIEGEPNASEPRTVPVTITGNQLSAKLTIVESARYRFSITSPSGTRSIEATPRAIEAEPDQPPTVQLMAPAEPLDVTNLRRIELAYVIEDDFGLSTAELVWEAGKDRGKKPIQLDSGQATGRAQGKFVWDIAEVQVPSGGEVRYWVEAKDNRSITMPGTPAATPNIGKSRELHLKVVSPRERHEETLGRQQEVAEKVLKNLADRLTMDPDDHPAREQLGAQLRETIVELGSVAAAFEKDPHASDAMRKALAQMRDRLEKLASTEQKWVPKGKPVLKNAFAAFDPKLVAELEDDTIVLADWLDRERMEGLLDITDEVKSHQKRLADLLAQYQRTKDPRLLDEIEREMKAIDRSLAELDKHRRGMPEDVLDQYVNQSALQAQQGSSCIDEVRALVRAGQHQAAAAKLEACRAAQDKASSALEGSLANLRGDKFSDEQKKLDEVMNELADVARDQDDIAAEANRIFEEYAAKADEVAKDNRREASKKVGALVDKLRRRLAEIDDQGLTPFAKEELDIVERRIGDVEKMVADGDLAEALGMAHQAKQSLDTIAGELEAALEDDPKSKWADETQNALDGVERATPVAKELIAELQSLAPRPDQIMSSDDLKALERLRRREAMNKQRAQRLADRTKQLSADLPGDTGAELGKKLGSAIQQMQSADDRMKGKDPSGTREATRAAADALAKARDRARSAARQAQEGATSDEPIKIPGADEYRAPERFREDLLEAMKKKGSQGPDGYDDMIKRYYEDLIK